jgi:hypothetical protein
MAVARMPRRAREIDTIAFEDRNSVLPMHITAISP